MTDLPIHRRDGQHVWRFLNRLMIAIIVIASLIIIGFLFVPPLRQQREQSARVEQLKSEINNASLLLARRTREAELLKHDPAYLELIARDRLDLMKEGETIYRTDPQLPDRSAFRLRR